MTEFEARHAALLREAPRLIAWRRSHMPNTLRAIVGSGRSPAGERQTTEHHDQVRSYICAGRPSVGGRRTIGAVHQRPAQALSSHFRGISRENEATPLHRVIRPNPFGGNSGPPVAGRRTIKAPEFEVVHFRRLGIHTCNLAAEGLAASVWPNPSVNRTRYSRLRRLPRSGYVQR